MTTPDLNPRLSQIKTQWTLMFDAHRGPEGAEAAAGQLLLRYYRAVYRYLLGTVREPAVAEELTQDFAMRFLRGDFQRANPQRGRFRDFLKTALRHQAVDHWRKQGKAAQPLPAADLPAGEELDRPFLDGWREELLARTWEALAQEQEQTGHPYHTALHQRTLQPEASSQELADQLSAALGKALSVDGFRHLLQRARRRFADLLVDEVARSLQTDEPDLLEQELIELELLDYCRSALGRRGGP